MSKLFIFKIIFDLGTPCGSILTFNLKNANTLHVKLCQTTKTMSNPATHILNRVYSCQTACHTTDGNISSSKAIPSFDAMVPGNLHKTTCNRSSEVMEGNRLYFYSRQCSLTFSSEEIQQFSDAMRMANGHKCITVQIYIPFQEVHTKPIILSKKRKIYRTLYTKCIIVIKYIIHNKPQAVVTSSH